jgi:hypothetical protein
VAPERSIEVELDERHRAANLAFAKRDILAYQGLFSPSLSYQRADGKILDREHMMRDVAVQFRNLSHAVSFYVRERLVVAGDEVTETLVQTVEAQVTAFGILHRRWSVDRRGNYTWKKSCGAWAIERVKIHSETVLAVGWRFGFRRS